MVAYPRVLQWYNQVSHESISFEKLSFLSASWLPLASKLSTSSLRSRRLRVRKRMERVEQIRDPPIVMTNNLSVVEWAGRDYWRRLSPGPVQPPAQQGYNIQQGLPPYWSEIIAFSIPIYIPLTISKGNEHVHGETQHVEYHSTLP